MPVFPKGDPDNTFLKAIRQEKLKDLAVSRQPAGRRILHFCCFRKWIKLAIVETALSQLPWSHCKLTLLTIVIRFFLLQALSLETVEGREGTGSCHKNSTSMESICGQKTQRTSEITGKKNCWRINFILSLQKSLFNAVTTLQQLRGDSLLFHTCRPWLLLTCCWIRPHNYRKWSLRSLV